MYSYVNQFMLADKEVMDQQKLTASPNSAK
jgi:hypothetical protein